MKKEIKKYASFSKSEIIDNITSFTSRVWQVHPFMEGNTRTTALFIEQYLKQLGFSVDNTLFKEKAVFFRNALVRANYADYSKGINEEDKFLKMFFVNLLYEGEYTLQLRDLIIPNGESASVLNKLHANQKVLSEEKKRCNWRGAIPVEVKSADNTKAKSLNVYIKTYKPKYAIKISAKNFSYEDGKKIIPLYAVFCI